MYTGTAALVYTVTALPVYTDTAVLGEESSFRHMASSRWSDVMMELSIRATIGEDLSLVMVQQDLQASVAEYSFWAEASSARSEAVSEVRKLLDGALKLQND